MVLTIDVRLWVLFVQLLDDVVQTSACTQVTSPSIWVSISTVLVTAKHWDVTLKLLTTNATQVLTSLWHAHT